MTNEVTSMEKRIFREAFEFFARHCCPPANHEENAVDWWTAAAKDVADVDCKWTEYPLMRGLLLAIYEYMEYKAKEKTKEIDDFVQEQ